MTTICSDPRSDGAADGDDQQGSHPHYAQCAVQRPGRRESRLWPVQARAHHHGERGPARLVALAFRSALYCPRQCRS